MLKLRNALQHRLLEATTQAFPLADVVVDFPLSPATKPEFGDFQANGAMGLAKVKVNLPFCLKETAYLVVKAVPFRSQ